MASPWHKYDGINTMAQKGQAAPNDTAPRGRSGIHIKASHRGLLHKELGVSSGSKIPASKLSKAAHSSNPAERKRAVFAENAKKWNHK